jgi:hypothetical protein
MAEQLYDQATMTITLDDVVSTVKGLTLADEDVPFEGQILKAIAAARFAHTYDVKVTDVEIMSWDQMHKLIPVPMRDPVEAWEVDYTFLVWCDHCERVAIHQTEFSSNLCDPCFKDAMEQHWADLRNDDRAVGLG